MAVSGRKPPNLSDSVLKSSTEDFDYKCDPCHSDKQVVEAAGFCVTCQEYLCKSCFKFHQKTSALKHHELLDEVSMLTSARREGTNSVPEIFTERCSTHKDEFIKFFCPRHETLGCTDCITLNHRTCKIDYIPDKCAGIAEGEEYTEVMRNLDQRIKETDYVMKKAEHRDKSIDTQYQSVRNEVAKHRKQIDDRLDKMQEKINHITESRKSQDKQVVKEAISVCSEMSRDVKKMQISLQDNKASKRNIQIYIDMKQAKSKLKAKAIQHAEHLLDTINVKYKFKSNDELEKLTFGEVSFPIKSSNVSRKESYSKCLTYVDKINVKTDSDKPFFKCNVIGCAAIGSKLVLIDSVQNEKIKLVDMDKKTVVEEKVIHPPPSGITALPKDQIAVTVPQKKEILIMTVSNEISLVRAIKLSEVCRHITYGRGRLFVLCHDPQCILKLDTQGKVLDKISLERELFRITSCIAYSENVDKLYVYSTNDLSVNDGLVRSVIALNASGEIFAERRTTFNVKDMVVLDDGSLLVCCDSSSNFYRFSGDLKEYYTVDTDIEYTFSVCYNRKQGKIYTGSYSSDLLKICDVKI